MLQQDWLLQELHTKLLFFHGIRRRVQLSNIQWMRTQLLQLRQELQLQIQATTQLHWMLARHITYMCAPIAETGISLLGKQFLSQRMLSHVLLQQD
ncbi:hypothetical protein D3C86_1531560 [compost metagenome]